MIKIPQTRINTEFFITKEKHRPRSSYVCKNSVLSAPSGARTLDTLIKSQTHVRKKSARTPRRMGVWGFPRRVVPGRSICVHKDSPDFSV